MKKRILTLLTLAFTYGSMASNQDVYRLSVEITDLIYAQREDFSPQKKQLISEHFQSIKKLIENNSSLNCGTRQNVYQDAFGWGSSISGANLSRREAMDLAEQISNKACPLLYLESYKNTYSWATSISGLNAYRSKALEFSTLVSDYNAGIDFTSDVLECIKSQFEFAISISGLNLPRSQAEEFAKKQCLL